MYALLCLCVLGVCNHFSSHHNKLGQGSSQQQQQQQRHCFHIKHSEILYLNQVEALHMQLRDGAEPVSRIELIISMKAVL